MSSEASYPHRRSNEFLRDDSVDAALLSAYAHDILVMFGDPESHDLSPTWTNGDTTIALARRPVTDSDDAPYELHVHDPMGDDTYYYFAPSHEQITCVSAADRQMNLLDSDGALVGITVLDTADAAPRLLEYLEANRGEVVNTAIRHVPRPRLDRQGQEQLRRMELGLILPEIINRAIGSGSIDMESIVDSTTIHYFRGGVAATAAELALRQTAYAHDPAALDVATTEIEQRIAAVVAATAAQPYSR